MVLNEDKKKVRKLYTDSKNITKIKVNKQTKKDPPKHQNVTW
jgi:hypothetical protein